MIHAETYSDGARSREADELRYALGALSIRDRRILGRLARRLALIEGAHGEDLALAAAERMVAILRAEPAPAPALPMRPGPSQGRPRPRSP
jgi:hypothetical protein